MSLRVSSHLYRNRHGTYYFRFTIPKRLRTLAGQGELRFSLGTEIRKAAIISALPIIADLPHLVGCLQRMADTNESPPSDYFKDWQLQMQESAKLRVDIVRLKDELESQRHQIAGMVPRTGAKDVVKQAYTSGQLKGKKELELRLVFPWPSENTKRFSELLAAYMRSFTFRASGGRKKPPGAKTLDGYEKPESVTS